MPVETLTICLPPHWASALINGDHSGLEDDESELVAKYETDYAADGWSFVDVAEEHWFTWNIRIHVPEAPYLGGDVCEYTLIKITPDVTLECKD